MNSKRHHWAEKIGDDLMVLGRFSRILGNSLLSAAERIGVCIFCAHQY
jgi:hypothetical protein